MILRLGFRPPFHWEETLDFLACRCTAGVEAVEDGAWRRAVRLGRRTGWVEVRPDGRRAALRVELSPSLAPVRRELAARLRAAFDLDLDPVEVARVLRRDPLLAPSVRRLPGLRVHGSIDPFESAVRVVLGQQVSVRAATTVAGRLAVALGAPIRTPFPAIHRLPVTPQAVLSAGEGTIARLGMPGARARTLLAIAAAVRSGSLDLARGGDAVRLRERLLGLPGVGPWTADLVLMRAVGAPDAFPAGDLGVTRMLGVRTAEQAEARAEPFRPWRAYAAMHLWALGATDRRSTSRSPGPAP